ncbi:MAG TPA: hypothetical protein VGH32_00920 [Pirellulales bacterium]
MSDNKDEQRSKDDAEIEDEIRRGRKFTMEEAIGRMAGPGAMKGVSPVTRMQQAVNEIENWLGQHMPPSNGDLKLVLLRSFEGSEILLHNYERPLFAMGAYCQQLLDSDYRLKELVRETDFEWGRTNSERPYFEKEGLPAHPNDPYTFESVRKTLTGLLEQLAGGES